MKMQEMAGVRSLSSSFEMQCYSVICNKWKCDLLLHEKSHADPKDNWDPLEVEWMTGLLCRPLFVCVCNSACTFVIYLFYFFVCSFYGFLDSSGSNASERVIILSGLQAKHLIYNLNSNCSSFLGRSLSFCWFSCPACHCAKKDCPFNHINLC